MTAPRVGPCANWIADSDITGCAPCAGLGPLDATDASLAASAASEFLFENTRRRWPGLCEKVVRPSTRWHERDDRSGSLWSALPEWTRWRSNTDPHDDEGYRTIFEVGLIGYPVVAVEEVWVDGVQLPGTSYRVDDFRWLVRTDGNPWPSFQDLSLDAHNPALSPTFEVKFQHGTAPPKLGVIAAREFACELYKGLKGDDCQIPDRVVNMVRQGTTFALISPADFDKGKTGIRSVDLFLSTYNPNRRGRRGTILSPDVPPRGRRVGT